ncbi:MAG: glycosyltransferase [Bacteroidales bacterium]|nr:glycosyltransferase [Bacteroidales bacterium]
MNIYFKQRKSDSEVPLFFSAADVCVLPYKSATQSGIISIAYHFGLSIIATDVGGLKESVIDGETGIIVPKPEVDDIITGIYRFFEQGMFEKFAKNILTLKQQLSWENFAQTIVDFSKSL